MRRKRKFILLALLFLSIGFAAVTTTLVLNGTLTIVANSNDFEKNVVFTKAETDSEGKAGISLDGKAITFKSKELKEISEISELGFNVTNKSKQYGVDAIIKCVKSDEENPFNDYIDLTIEPNEFSLDKGETQSGKLLVKMVKSFVGTDESNSADIEIKCTISATAKESEYDENETYIPDTSKNKVISGYLVDENNNPLANKTIVITSGDQTYYVTTDKNGYYEIEVLPGNYDVYIVDGKTLEELNKMTKEEVEKQSSSKGTLTTNNNKISFESGVKSEEKKKVSGYLVDKDNNPLANKTIVITSGDQTYYVTTDENGYYEVEVIPGNYEVYVVDGKTPEEIKKMPINEVKEEAIIKGTYSTNNENLSFESGAKVEEKKTISGYLVDENNNPIANQTIIITSGNKTYYVTTDENGYYEVEVIPGNYEVYVVDGKTPEEVKNMSKEEIKKESSINGSYSTNNENLSFESGAKVEEKKTILGYLVDENNNPIANQTIIITSGNKTYYVTTDENGYYEVEVIPGNYEVYVVDGKTPEEIKKMPINEVKEEAIIKGTYSTTDNKPTFNEGVKTTTSEPKTITFDTSSLGTTIPSINVIEGEPYGQLPEIKKEGYNFEG